MQPGRRRRARRTLLATAALTPLAGLAPSAAAASTASIDVDPGALVRIYGAAGTFGALPPSGATPSGDALSTVAVRGWGFLPGQAAYFPTVAPDGTVVIANEPQTDNQLLPTARQMALTTFNPANQRFANTVVPTSTGRTELGGPWPDATGIVGGADISDIGLIRTGKRARVVFTSAMPFWGWASGGGEYPTLGVLRPGDDGSWVVDRARSRTASQIAASAARAARSRAAAARRTHGRRAARAARAAAAAIDDACTARSYPGMDRYGDCRMPAEFEQLPASEDLVLTQYAFDDPARPSGRLSIVDSGSGRVRASYPYPRIALADGTTLAVHPREVVADPFGRRGDERFVVIFDAERGTGEAGAPSVPGAIQEFSYDARAGTITPTSAPVLSGGLWDGAALGFETAAYDGAGDLVVGQSVVGTLQAGPLAIYQRRRGARGTLGERAACDVGPRWRGQGWGRTCPPDAEVAAAAGLGIARSLNWNADTGTMLLVTMSGAVLPVRDTAGSPVAGRPVDVGLGQLADRSVLRIGPRKAALDERRRTLWIPIQQLATERTCAAWPCSPRALDQWLVAVDASRVS